MKVVTNNKMFIDFVEKLQEMKRQQTAEVLCRPSRVDLHKDTIQQSISSASRIAVNLVKQRFSQNDDPAAPMPKSNFDFTEVISFLIPELDFINFMLYPR